MIIRSCLRPACMYGIASQSSEIPERELWVGVLKQAIEDVRKPSYPEGGKKYRAHGRIVVQDAAIHWFFSEATSIGSFYFICEILDLVPEKIRAQLFGINRRTSAATG